MKNVNLDMNTLKNYFAKFGKNLSWLFFAFFLLLLVLEVFQIKSSVDIVLNINQTPTVPATQTGVRINFGAYQQVVTRINGASSFQAASTTLPNPFAVPLPASVPQ